MNSFYNEMEYEVLADLMSADVAFIVVGGAAVQHYRRVRVRKDLDILLKCSAENAAAAARALKPRHQITPEIEAGFGSLNAQIKLSGHYNFIEFLTAIHSVTFEQAQRDIVLVTDHKLDKPIPILSKAHLIASKRARGDPQDIEDIAFLEGIRE